MTVLQKDHVAVAHIIDELLSYAIAEKASEIAINIKTEGSTIAITLSDNGRSALSERQLEKLKRILNQPRRDDLEEYYGQLLGHGTHDSGLALIAAMTDRVEIETNDQGTIIRLWRKYHG